MMSYIHHFTTLHKHRVPHARHIYITYGAFPYITASR